MAPGYSMCLMIFKRRIEGRDSDRDLKFWTNFDIWQRISGQFGWFECVIRMFALLSGWGWSYCCCCLLSLSGQRRASSLVSNANKQLEIDALLQWESRLRPTEGFEWSRWNTSGGRREQTRRLEPKRSQVKKSATMDSPASPIPIEAQLNREFDLRIAKRWDHWFELASLHSAVGFLSLSLSLSSGSGASSFTSDIAGLTSRRPKRLASPKSRGQPMSAERNDNNK